MVLVCPNSPTTFSSQFKVTVERIFQWIFVVRRPSSHPSNKRMNIRHQKWVLPVILVEIHPVLKYKTKFAALTKKLHFQYGKEANLLFMVIKECMLRKLDPSPIWRIIEEERFHKFLDKKVKREIYGGSLPSVNEMYPFTEPNIYFYSSCKFGTNLPGLRLTVVR